MTEYEELSPRKQALVDELARERIEGLNRTNQEIADAAAEGTEYDAYTPGYVSTLKENELSDVIDERSQMLANDGLTHGEETGKVEVEVGNSKYEGPAKGLDLTGDGKANTPEEAKAVRKMLANADTNDREFVVGLSRKDALAVIRSAPEPVAKRVFRRLVE